MNSMRVYDLSDCTEYRQTLLVRPPRLVLGTLMLLVALVTAGTVWAAFTEADLVVRAHGRVRPMTSSTRSPEAAAEESEVSPLRGGRVVEVHVREGDRVRRGDLLVRLDTEQLENDIAQQMQLVQTSELELHKLDERELLLKQRFETATAKAEAELTQAKLEIDRARKRRDADIRLAHVTLKTAEVELQRARKLAEKQAVTDSELLEAETRQAEAQLKFEKAQLPVDEGRLPVLQQALELVEREYAVECTDLDARRELKRSELAAARLEQANLEWQREQSELRAPSDGTVTLLNVTVGEIVEVGQPLVAVAEQCGFRIDVAVTSQDVGLLREGMPVRVKLDAFDFQKYGCLTGRVVFIAPDSEIDTAGDPRRMPVYTVKIALDDDQVGRGIHRGQVKLGMTGIAEIVTDQEGILSLLVRSIRQSVSLG